MPIFLPEIVPEFSTMTSSDKDSANAPNILPVALFMTFGVFLTPDPYTPVALTVPLFVKTPCAKCIPLFALWISALFSFMNEEFLKKYTATVES
jgi:hypothetical protein